MIPIGVDCGVVDFMKKYNLRNLAFPFDYVVTYNGVSTCIQDNFKDFMPNPDEQFNKYDIYFPHDFKSASYYYDVVKYTRRIKRFQTLLETSKELIFCRKGHATHHHKEHSGKYSILKSDIEDAEALDRILKERYPTLNYTIHVFLVCGTCFSNCVMIGSDRIKIHNIATPAADAGRFENEIIRILNEKYKVQ